MALYLVGENLDKTRGHYQAQTGKIVQVMRGIYVDAGDDVEAVVLKHAIRIARYLYPRAYLSGASAVLLTPTPDGRLFLSGRRNQRMRIRALEIIQNTAPKRPAIAPAVVDDGMGEFRIDVSSIRQRFLEGFRMRSEHAAALDETMRNAIAVRLVEEYGTAKDAADAVWGLARENEWYREGEAAERHLLRLPGRAPVKNQAVLDLIVAWHGTPMGHLKHDGFEWRWNANAGSGPALIRQTTPGKLPPFIIALLPEGWLESVLQDKEERAVLRSGKRYLSNITVVQRESELAILPRDMLQTFLQRYSKNGVFTGRYAGPGQDELRGTFERNLAKIYERADTPRLSGVQIKAPMCLDADGVLSPSTGKPFTHILKPAGPGGFEAMPIIEWLAMSLGREVGFVPPATALIAMPDGMAPALIVERFDIRSGLEDKRKLALEDFCSLLELPSEDKYKGTMERVAKVVRPLSTAPEEDVLIIFKRALFAWLIADGDMHLKNMALLKIAEPGSQQFRSVRMAPLYDALTTRVFPGFAHDRLALKVNGKDDRLQRSHFLAFAATIGLKTSVAKAAIDQMLEQLADAVRRATLPKELGSYSPASKKIAKEMLEIIGTRIDSFTNK